MHRLHKIYLTLGAGLVLAGGLILSICVFAANRQNEMSRTTQQQIVRFETQHLFQALAGKLSPMIYWQDAYDKVSVRWDQKWVDYQFGSYLDSLGINSALGQAMDHCQSTDSLNLSVALIASFAISRACFSNSAA